MNQKIFHYDAICRSGLLQSVSRSGNSSRVFKMLKNGGRHDFG